jgi:O-methyltransferase
VDSSTAALNYRKVIVSRIARRLLLSLQSLLPKSVYTPFYTWSFACYKTLLRLLYFRHAIYYRVIGDHENYHKAKTVFRVMAYSLVGASGLEATFDAAIDVCRKNISGCFVECGVAEGGCSALMGLVLVEQSQARDQWLFDSFEGLPDPTVQDYDESDGAMGEHGRPLVKGSCLGTREKVEQLLFSKFRLDQKRTFLVKGWFQDTLPERRNEVGAISFLRIDGDWYESTKCCLENLYDQVVPGGYIVIDDYGTFLGCKRAFDEFVNHRGLNLRIFPDGRGGVLFAKPGLDATSDFTHART